MATKSLVPFSPVPTHQVQIPFNGLPTVDGAAPWSDMTYAATPIQVLWEDNYRNAAIRLVFGREDTAREHARLGMALEEAYMSRRFAEIDAEKASVPA